MELLEDYKKLAVKADKYLGLHDSECSKMFKLLSKIIDVDLSDASVFYQTDGYVLVKEMLNAPVDKLIELYLEKGNVKLTLDEILWCGI